jgi:hypothetical protein
MEAHLRRSLYKTDFDVSAPEVLGTQTISFPVMPGWAPISVNWTNPGWVEVTWLVPDEPT